MAGTKAGGIKARETNLVIHGPDFYRRIGALGGAKNQGNLGFAYKGVGRDGLTGRQRARVVGVKGGRLSRRTARQTTGATS